MAWRYKDWVRCRIRNAKETAEHTNAKMKTMARIGSKPTLEATRERKGVENVEGRISAALVQAATDDSGHLFTLHILDRRHSRQRVDKNSFQLPSVSTPEDHRNTQNDQHSGSISRHQRRHDRVLAIPTLGQPGKDRYLPNC